MADPHWLLINRVLTQGRMVNSYKPALLRALADYGSLNRKDLTVSFEWLAEQFVRYYWPLAIRYRVRQATDPIKEPVVVRLIKELNVGSMVTVDQFRQRNRAEFDSLVTRLAKPGATSCLGEVLPRFHVLPSEAPAILYDQNVSSIEIRREALEFIQEHQKTLRLLAIGWWVRFTEKFSFSPRLWEKIEGQAKRQSLTSHRQALLQLGIANSCFYCDRPLEQEWDVDHFLPWSFVLDDKLWNLVPSCKTCNSKKSDGVPARQIDALVGRNESIFRQISRTRTGCSKNADFREWSPISLADHISLLSRNALAEGFPRWDGP
jgi:hypothetical protein